MKHFNHDSQIRGRRLVSWLVATFAFLGLFGSLTINLVPATIYQSSAPIETPDTDPKPMYSPSKDYHWPTKQIPYKIKKTTSRHYVKVWQKAVQAWNNVGVVSLVAIMKRLVLKSYLALERTTGMNLMAGMLNPVW
ncbi:hypothetical protein [Lentilactobacillus kisonensis]|uniref:Uncharacterized protein n=1 Tax=Lentilactobacillus kisonensis F0435 TaxID=797516 RepID=H1LKJ7_9LACO|nr:hypothetical protein [Lentilactobacillus kisonensis]EHO46646.1 hypothetical protein HMPREF9104_03151 [Lentilactobacillus kisonensis F0435]